MNAHDDKVGKRTARLFRNGRSQAVRLPKAFEFEGKEVLVSRTEDGKVVLEAKQPRRSPILAWLEANGPIEDFPGDPGHDDLLPRRL